MRRYSVTAPATERGGAVSRARRCSGVPRSAPGTTARGRSSRTRRSSGTVRSMSSGCGSSTSKGSPGGRSASQAYSGNWAAASANRQTRAEPRQFAKDPNAASGCGVKCSYGGAKRASDIGAASAKELIPGHAAEGASSISAHVSPRVSSGRHHGRPAQTDGGKALATARPAAVRGAPRRCLPHGGGLPSRSLPQALPSLGHERRDGRAPFPGGYLRTS